MGEMRKAYEIQVGKPRYRWEDNVRMGIREIWWEGME
jgi:hypothetical protein